MRVLVLGGYGLIGLEIVRRLRADGLEVAGLGRSRAAGERAAPGLAWTGTDIAKLTTPGQWAPYLRGIDAVVNAAGALQDGAKDNLTAVHHTAIAALIAACAAGGVTRFIQISAPGAEPNAATAFLRTKAAGDAALRASALDWLIFKPGLVIAQAPYGGTALLRQLAAFPFVQPIMLGSRRIQTVSATDVAQAVSHALATPTLTRRDFDLVEPAAHTLTDIVLQFRRWLGFRAPIAVIEAPRFAGAVLARLADGAGWLGWRSPLRTTALKVLDHDVRGDPEPWRAAAGHAPVPLDVTLSALPTGAQERLAARAQLIYPLLLITLAAYWIASGVIGLWQTPRAAAVLVETPLAPQAPLFVTAGAVLDIAIGAALLIRPFTRAACAAAVAVSCVYLALASFLTPELWGDPLGPLIKIFPGMALAFGVAALTQDR